MSLNEPGPEDRRVILARQADVRVSRLLRTVDALSRRRRSIEAVGHDATTIALATVKTVAGLALLTGAVIWGAFYVARKRNEHRLAHRLAQWLEKQT